jgi:hypothetical protein
MENQGLSQGSLRNSHRETHAVRRKPAPASFHDLAQKLVESCSEDLIIRQRLDPDRSEVPLKRGTFYVLENEGRADPGFIVVLPGKPVLFHQQRRGRPAQTWTLRMRVGAAVGEGGGSVLVGTLDDVLHTLRLEDVWMWRGEVLAGKVDYSARRARLKEFVERHWVPDARLMGGIFTTVANPVSLEVFTQKGVADGCNSVEFIPEQAGRRRLVWFLEGMVKAAEALPGMKQGRSGGAATGSGGAATGNGMAVAASEASRGTMARSGGAATGNGMAVAASEVTRGPATGSGMAAARSDSPAPAPPPPPQPSRRARAVPVDKMPDVYDLFGEDGLPISRASVQQFRVSQALKEVLAKKGELWVQARWRPEFGGYEIQGVDSNNRV